jgi:hypothetical protein
MLLNAASNNALLITHHEGLLNAVPRHALRVTRHAWPFMLLPYAVSRMPYAEFRMACNAC